MSDAQQGSSASGTASATAAAPLLRFLVPSIIGALVFLTPIQHDGAWTILLGVATAALKSAAGDAMGAFLLVIVTVSSLTALAGVASTRVARFLSQRDFLRAFQAPPLWLVLRVLGTVIAWMIVVKAGPEFIWSESTGGVALYSLCGEIAPIFLCAAFLLPMLTDFGLLEFVGTLLQGLFRRLFTLPGRAAVDALASWLSSAPVGVMITIGQFEKGAYTRREALVIATNFSVTSLPFCLFVIGFMRLEALLFPVYGTVVLTGICCAVLLPRLPPLRGVEDRRGTNDPDDGPQAAPDVAGTGNAFSCAVLAARRRAANGPGPRRYLRASLQHLLDAWMGLMPIVVLIGTLGLALSEFTTIVRSAAAPLAPILACLGLPEAAAAAPTFIVGFLDMFLPAAIGQGIDSEYTRYVIASVSLAQLIYLSEVGALLLRSSLRVGVGILLSLFLLRTIIALPLALTSARLILGEP